MKKGGTTPIINNMPSSIPQSAIPPSSNPYYTQNFNPAAPAPMPATPPPMQNPSNATPMENVQWPMTVRPAPVGSEGTDTPANCNNLPSVSPEKRFNNLHPSPMDSPKINNHQLPNNSYVHQNQINHGMLPKVNNNAQPYSSTSATTPTYSYPSAVGQGYPSPTPYMQPAAYPPTSYQQPQNCNSATAKPPVTPNYPNQYPQQQYYQPKLQYPPNSPQASNQQYTAKPVNNYSHQYYQTNPQGSYIPPQPLAYPTPVSSTQPMTYPAPASTPQPGQPMAYPTQVSTPQPAQQPMAYPTQVSTPQLSQQPMAYPPVSTPTPQHHYPVQPHQAATSQYGGGPTAQGAAYPSPVSTPQPHQGYAPQQGASSERHAYAYTYPYNNSTAYPAQQQSYGSQQYSGNVKITLLEFMVLIW